MTTTLSQTTDPRDPRNSSDPSPDHSHNKRDEPSVFDLVTNPEEFDNWQRERHEEERENSTDR